MNRRIFLHALAGCPVVLAVAAPAPLPTWRWIRRENWDFDRETVTVSLHVHVVDDRGMSRKFGLGYVLTRKVIVNEPDKCAAMARQLSRAQRSSEEEFVARGYRPR